jgi:hypothetical protein
MLSATILQNLNFKLRLCMEKQKRQIVLNCKLDQMI